MDTRSEWKDADMYTFYLYRSETDPDPLVLYPGACVTWEGRPDYVKIVDVYGQASEIGPRGFTYLPYRKEGRWASKTWSLRGDARFVICYPAGTPHYGLHVPLQTMVVDDAPLYEGPPGEMTQMSHLTIIELRHKILKLVETMGASCQIHKNVYACHLHDVRFNLCITRDVMYRVDVYPITGNLPPLDL